MSKPMKAYEVREKSEGRCVIAFATNGATARRDGASELHTDFEGIESCRRAPQFDGYAPGPVPTSALLADGWWFECQHCGITFDADGRHGEEAGSRDDECEPVDDGKAHYCSPTCKMEHWAEKRQRTLRQLAAIEAALTHWPMATGVRADESCKEWPSRDYEMRAYFTLPGIKHPVDWAVGSKDVMVSHCDADDFRRLYGKKQEAA